MTQITTRLVGIAFTGTILVKLSVGAVAQEVPQILAPVIPTTDPSQLFPPIPTAPAIEPPALPEVTTIITPQIPTSEFPETNLGTTPLDAPVLNPIPFNAPQFTPPQFVSPVLAPPTPSAPNLAAPVFSAVPFTAPQATPPTFSGPAFAAPALASPTLTAPTLTFLAAPESQNSVEPVNIPQVVPPEPVNLFGN